MGILELKREGENYRISLFDKHPHKKNKKKVYYWNVLTKDKKRLAQIFLDLYFEGFPVEDAFKTMKQKIENKDWIDF